MDADNTQYGAGSASTGSTGGNLGGNLGSTSSSANGFDATSASTPDYGSNLGNSETNESRARRLADMARDAASQAKAKAGEQVNSTLDKGRNRAADTLQEVARTLMGQGGLESDVANQYLSRAGEQVQRVADYLQSSDPRRMVADAENFARRQPALFLGSAFAIGVLAARFLKASRPDNDDGMYGDGGAGRLYDRETALSSYREPLTDYSASTTGPLGDDEMDEWSNGLGNAGGTTGSTNDLGTNRGYGTSGDLGLGNR